MTEQEKQSIHRLIILLHRMRQKLVLDRAVVEYSIMDIDVMLELLLLLVTPQ